MIERRAIIAVVAATGAFGVALWLRGRVDPWLGTATAAAVGGTLAVWALGRRRLRVLLAVDGRGLALAAALGVALVIATHVGFQIAAPWLGPHVRGLYASIDTVVPHQAQAAITFMVVVAEELVWRGCALSVASAVALPVASSVDEVAVSLPPSRSSSWVVFTSVVLYAIPQILGGEWVLVLAALCLGTVFAIQRVRTRRLLDALLTHAIWSLAIFVVFPLAPPA